MNEQPILPHPPIVPNRPEGHLPSPPHCGSSFHFFEYCWCAAQCFFAWLIYFYRSATPADIRQLDLAVPQSLHGPMTNLLNHRITHSEAFRQMLPVIYHLESWNSLHNPLRLKTPATMSDTFYWMLVAISNSLCFLQATWTMTCANCGNLSSHAAVRLIIPSSLT